MCRLKNFVVILILITLMGSLIFSGCKQVETINAPMDIKYIVKNPIEIVEHTIGQNEQFTYTYISIQGLKNKDIEKKINEKIKALYDEMLIQDLPPYRGIKAEIPEGSQIVQESLYMSPSGNYNNILSIMINKYITYAVPNKDGNIVEYENKYYDNSRYVSETEGLNFDLNTGEEIALEDIFCDNVNYLEILNDLMSDYLSKNHAEEEGYYYTMNGDLKLVESFKGLSEDQKFVLFTYGISLIMDYNTPQFETRNMAMTPIINFNDVNENLAITERYYDEKENIFDSKEPPIKSLLQGFADQDMMGYDHSLKGKVNFYTNWSYSSRLPQKIQDIIEEYKEVDQKEIDQMNRELEGLPDSVFEEYGTSVYECHIYADSIGNYINVMRNIFKNMPDHYEQLVEYRCFDSTTLKELELKDIFMEGFDFKPVILESIKKTLSERDTNSGDINMYDEEDIESMYNNIKGFNLITDDIYIPTAELQYEGSTYTMSLYIPYANFGCENMTIFD